MQVMKVFRIIAEADSVMRLDTDHDYFNSNFRGVKYNDSWIAPAVRVIRERKRVNKCVSWGYAAPVFSQDAVDVLQTRLCKFGEFLLLATVRGIKLYAFNTTNIVDCLDRTRSQIHYDTGSGAIVNVLRTVVDERRLRESFSVFKVPEALSQTLVTKEVVDMFVDYRISGSIFIESDANPFSFMLVSSPSMIRIL